MAQHDLFDSMEENKIGQENEGDLYNKNINSFSEAVLWSTDWTTETVVRQLDKGNIEINPNFQRRDAWNDKRKSSFIESLALGLPIPQIILAERKEKKGSYIVIDGKQRLLSIRRFYATAEDDFKPLKLRGLEILNDINGESYSSLNQAHLNSELVDSIDNQPIRTVVIRNWPSEDFLYTVFLRLNTGSLPLSPQELRQALNPGSFVNYVDDFSIESKALKKSLGISDPDYRMRDVEIVIRYFAFKNFLTDYSGNLKQFLDNTCKTLNERWDNDGEDQIKKQAKELENSIETTIEIFGLKNSFSKWSNDSYTNIFNRPVFDIMSFYFSDIQIRKEVKKYPEDVKKGFEELCEENPEFLRSLETSTKNLNNTIIRFSEWGKKLKDKLDLKIKIPYKDDGGKITLDYAYF